MSLEKICSIINETTKNITTKNSDQSFTFDRPGEYLLMMMADESMPFFGKPLGDVYFPEGMRLAAIMRNGKPVYPTILDRVASGDRLVFFVSDYDPVEMSRHIGRPFLGL